jgi:hypothetical protein
LIGHENIIRVNPVVPAGKYTLDGTKMMESLIGLGETEARKELPRINPLLSAEVEAFKPLRSYEERGSK